MIDYSSGKELIGAGLASMFFGTVVYVIGGILADHRLAKTAAVVVAVGGCGAMALGAHAQFTYYDRLHAFYESGGRLVCDDSLVLSKTQGWKLMEEYLIQGDTAIHYTRCRILRELPGHETKEP